MVQNTIADEDLDDSILSQAEEAFIRAGLQ